MKDGKCSVAKIEEGNCDSAFKAAFDFIFCVDSFKTEGRILNHDFSSRCAKLQSQGQRKV